MVARGHVQNGVVVLAPATAASEMHSILDIPPVSLGSVVAPLTANDDLLGEMLEGRS
jgi:hypothetical protein